MWARIRAVLTVLVVLAIPVQGFAAATMLPCGPVHERMAGGAVGVHAHAAATVAHGHDHHVGVMAHGPAAHGSLDVATPDRAPFAPLADVKCSACATCCTVSAIPAVPLIVAVDRAASEAIPSRHQPSVDFVVERLEPPPRNRLA